MSAYMCVCIVSMGLSLEIERYYSLLISCVGGLSVIYRY